MGSKEWHTQTPLLNPPLGIGDSRQRDPWSLIPLLVPTISWANSKWGAASRLILPPGHLIAL